MNYNPELIQRLEDLTSLVQSQPFQIIILITQHDKTP